MFNLLPREEREVLRSEYHARQYVVYAGVLAFLGIVSVGLLLPSYITYVTTDLLLKSEQRAIRDAEPSEEKDTREIVARGTAIALQMKTFDTVQHSPTLDKLLERIVPGIRLAHVTFVTQPDKRIQIDMEGTAATRESLRAFDASLGRDNVFTGVDIPLSSYTRETNIPFSITFFALR